jgi:hypothetical protein
MPVVACSSSIRCSLQRHRCRPELWIEWMLRFQFDGDVDYFENNPVAYASALGESGMETYRAQLCEI